MGRGSHIAVLALLTSCVVPSAGLFAQVQPTNAPTSEPDQPRWLENHTPRGALWRASVPGWGQLYNRQYFKAPFVYAALGGFVYNSVRLNDKYLLYRHAYQFKAFEEITPDGEDNPKSHLESDYEELKQRLGIAGELPSASIRPIRDNLRRNRDLSILGAGLVYALSILDAFVSAHLLEFDVGEDLLVAVDGTTAGVRTSVRLSL